MATKIDQSLNAPWWNLFPMVFSLLAVIGLCVNSAFPQGIDLLNRLIAAVGVFLTGAAVGKLLAIAVLIWMIKRYARGLSPPNLKGVAIAAADEAGVVEEAITLGFVMTLMLSIALAAVYRVGKRGFKPR